MAICVACELDENDDLYYDVISVLEYEEYLEIKGQLRDTFGENKVRTMGGWELGFAY